MEQQSNEAKVGVTAPSGATGGSPSPIETKSTEQTASSSVNGTAQGQSQEKVESIPFGDKRHPEYKRFKELSESAKQHKAEAEQFRKELAELRGFKEAMLSQQRGQGRQISAEQKQALQELFSMGLEVPEIENMFKQKYGLDRLDSVHKDFSSFKENWDGQQYESEMRDVLSTAKDLGLNPDEVEEELREFVANDPFFSNKEYYKGGVRAAFNSKYFDRVGELRERADNLKKIKEREMLKNGQTQTSAETSNPAKPALPKKDGVNRNVEIIRQMGGADKLPFWKS